LFGRRGRILEKAGGADARIGRTRLNPMSGVQKKSRDDSIRGVLDSILPIFRRAAPHGVTQKPTPLINQGLRHDLH
jgi:hypothetical protein